MKIALLGYGKMGKTIEALGRKQGHEFPLKVDRDNPDELHADRVRGLDAAIEFSIPEAAAGNVRRCLELGIPVVSGTTGWNEELEEVKRYCRKQQGAFFWASNYSIGVNILFALNRELARVMKNFPAYHAQVTEVHHIHKLDAPSGTALSLAQDILTEHDYYQDWALEDDKEVKNGILPIRALREGEVKGKHHVRYESDLDLIGLYHEAKSRDAFASGALLAAEFLLGKKGIFGMKDLLNL